ncbi:hypothetical protein HK405_012329 [Cladochytrium tenue]|nr:hypothetical protein HK405_012329 [Cladochytrium tenue]
MPATPPPPSSEPDADATDAVASGSRGPADVQHTTIHTLDGTATALGAPLAHRLDAAAAGSVETVGDNRSCSSGPAVFEDNDVEARPSKASLDSPAETRDGARPGSPVQDQGFGTDETASPLSCPQNTDTMSAAAGLPNMTAEPHSDTASNGPTDTRESAGNAVVATEPTLSPLSNPGDFLDFSMSVSSAEPQSLSVATIIAISGSGNSDHSAQSPVLLQTHPGESRPSNHSMLLKSYAAIGHIDALSGPALPGVVDNPFQSSTTTLKPVLSGVDEPPDPGEPDDDALDYPDPASPIAPQIAVDTFPFSDGSEPTGTTIDLATHAASRISAGPTDAVNQSDSIEAPDPPDPPPPTTTTTSLSDLFATISPFTLAEWGAMPGDVAAVCVRGLAAGGLEGLMHRGGVMHRLLAGRLSDHWRRSSGSGASGGQAPSAALMLAAAAAVSSAATDAKQRHQQQITPDPIDGGEEATPVSAAARGLIGTARVVLGADGQVRLLLPSPPTSAPPSPIEAVVDGNRPPTPPKLAYPALPERRTSLLHRASPLPNSDAPAALAAAPPWLPPRPPPGPPPGPPPTPPPPLLPPPPLPSQLEQQNRPQQTLQPSPPASPQPHLSLASAPPPPAVAPPPPPHPPPPAAISGQNRPLIPQRGSSLRKAQPANNAGATAIATTADAGS